MSATEEREMNPSIHRSVLAFPFVACIAFASTATAATQAKTYEFSAADACQLSIPTTDTKVRPRANGYRNEGTSSQFVICGMGGYENDTVVSTTLRATSIDGQAHSMNCTGVTGLAGFDGPHYSTKTLAVPASGVGTQSWAAADFGGTGGEVIAGGLNLSVTCTLPQNVALQGFESQGIIDVGN
jgi:hypothetical protein